jgi:hypothetical protein
VVDELGVDVDALEVAVGRLMDGQGKASDSVILEMDFDEVVGSLQDNEDQEDSALVVPGVDCEALVDQANFEGGARLCGRTVVLVADPVVDLAVCH